MPKDISIAIFEALGGAEAKIHNRDIDTIHFHEVGAVDAIVDIVCAAVGSEALDSRRICLLPAERGWGNGKVHARNFSRACSGDDRVAKRCACLLIWFASRTGYSYRSCHRQNSRQEIRAISRDEDREGGLRSGHARFSRTRQCCPLNDR